MNENHFRLEDHDDFVHLVTHELKTPVSILKAYIQLVQARFSVPVEGLHDILQKMDVQIDKVLNLLSDLSDAAGSNSGLINCLMNDFNINNCIIDCVEGIRTAHPDFYMEYELDINNPIIKGDKERIDQVITNLIGNAIKYSPHQKYIRLSSELAVEDIVIKVTDHGIGVPTESREYVFERFYRANSGITSGAPGLGLGLFISAEIIKRHGGQFGLESEEGKGSTFWFSLPLRGIH